ncbi:MAG: translocation/assembly module TamB domain-containing protein [Sandaracinaceae bacterium]|nr:translocation/assembly module TamB domain-containing protein [Sandaracinaceae bacterium]
MLAILATLSLAIGLTQTSWGRARIRELTVTVIRDELGLDASFGELRVDLGLLPPRIEVVASEIALVDPVYGRLVKARRLVISPSVGALLRGELDLDEILIDGAVVNLIVREGEVRNLPRPRAEPDPNSPTRLPFSRLTLTDATVHVDASPDGALQLAGLEVDLRVEGGTILHLRVTGGEGHVRHGDQRLDIQSLRAAVSLDPDTGVDISELAIASEHFSVGASDAHIPLPFESRLQGNVQVRADLAHLADLPLGLELPPLRGMAEVDATIGMRDGSPEGHGQVRLRDGAIDIYGLGETVELDFDFDHTRARVTEMRFQVIEGGGVVTGHAEVGFTADLPLTATLDIDALQLAKLLKQLDVTPDAIAQWTLAGRIDLAGTLSPLDLGGPVRLRTQDFLVTADAWHQRPATRIMGIPRGRVEGRVTVTPEGLGFRDLDVTMPNSTAHVDLLLGFEDYIEVTGHSTQMDLADVTPLTTLHLGGRGSWRASVRGPYGSPAVEGHVQMNGFEFDTFRAGNIESDFVLENESMSVRFPLITAVKNESRYTVEDLLVDFRDNRFEVTALVHAQRMVLADLYHVFRLETDERFTPFQGVAHGTTRVRYSTGFPDDLPAGTLRATVDIGFSSAHFAGFAFDAGALEAEWRWIDYARGVDGAELDVTHLALHKAGGTVAIAGTMGLGGVLQLSVSADNIPFSATEGFEEMPELGGTWSLLGQIDGTSSVPHLHADLGMHQLAWAGEPLGDGRLYVRLTDRTDPWVAEAASWDPAALPEDEPCYNARAGLAHGRWPADPPLQTPSGPVQSLDRPMAFLLCGEALEGQVLVDMALGWTSDLPMRGRVRFNRMDLAPLLAGALPGAEATGVLNGEMRFDDGALSNDTYGGDLHLDTLEVEVAGIPIRNDGPIDVRFVRGEGRVQRMALVGPGTQLSVSGRASLRTGLRTRVDGVVDLGLLATTSPTVTDARGRLELGVRISGDASDPSVFGEARVVDGAFRFAGFPVPLEELNGHVTFSSHRLIFEDIHARLGSGWVDVAGVATIADGGLRDYAFDVGVRDAALRPMAGVDLGFDAQARLYWEPSMRLPMLRGQVQLERLVYSRTTSLSPTLGELNRPELEGLGEYDPANDNLDVELTITGRPIRVRNNLLTVDIAIADHDRPFQIVGTDQRLGVLGQLAVQRGSVRFRNAVLEMRNGDIRFDDATRINPSFDVTAETDIRTRDLDRNDWRISLHAYGNMDAFRLEARSDPSASEQDILLLLTIGLTTAQAQSLQAADLGGAALEAVSSLSGVNDEVSEALQVIDDFAITTMYSTRTNRPEPQVTIGKRIAERVRLTASTSLTGDTREIRAGVEWQLGDQTSIQAGYDNVNRETQSFGNVGVDFHWRIEFE